MMKTDMGWQSLPGSVQNLYAEVSGEVLVDDGATVCVECANGKIIKVHTNDTYTNEKGDEISSITGREVIISGWAFLKDGDFTIFARHIGVKNQEDDCYDVFNDSSCPEKST